MQRQRNEDINKSVATNTELVSSARQPTHGSHI